MSEEIKEEKPELKAAPEKKEPNEAKPQAAKKKKGPVFYLVLVVMVLLAGFGVSVFLNQKAEEQKSRGFRNANYAPNVEEDHELLLQFQKDFPDCWQVLRACEEDVNDDGRKDLVVVYRTGDLTRMVVCQNNEGGIVYSEPIPGPIENQQIQFKDIDKEGPIEFIVSGEKNGAVGYAIYRMIDGQPIDLFGEGMADCC